MDDPVADLSPFIKHPDQWVSVGDVIRLAICSPQAYAIETATLLFDSFWRISLFGFMSHNERESRRLPPLLRINFSSAF